MKEFIQNSIDESNRVKIQTLQEHVDIIIKIVQAITEVLKNGGKVILFGNGGSAADSQHIAAEFIGRFKKKRKSYSAIALTTDTSILTSLSNDYGFDIIFSRQIEGIANPGDILFAFSTSGQSKNVIEGLKTGKNMGLKAIGFSGNKGGVMAAFCDFNIIVASDDTARIQESHICFAHIICELVENTLDEK